jgi:hypothetical protein
MTDVEHFVHLLPSSLTVRSFGFFIETSVRVEVEFSLATEQFWSLGLSVWQGC